MRYYECGISKSSSPKILVKYQHRYFEIHIVKPILTYVLRSNVELECTSLEPSPRARKDTPERITIFRI